MISSDTLHTPLQSSHSLCKAKALNLTRTFALEARNYYTPETTSEATTWVQPAGPTSTSLHFRASDSIMDSQHYLEVSQL